MTRMSGGARVDDPDGARVGGRRRRGLGGGGRGDDLRWLLVVLAAEKREGSHGRPRRRRWRAVEFR